MLGTAAGMVLIADWIWPATVSATAGPVPL